MTSAPREMPRGDALLDLLEQAAAAGQVATHRRCGGLVAAGQCFDCGTSVPASEQVEA